MGKVETSNAVPPPGSNEAIAKGCTCPVLDNARGRGYYGQPGVYVYIVGCPVHAPIAYPPIFKGGTASSGPTE